MLSLRKTALSILLPVLILGWGLDVLHPLWQDHHQFHHSHDHDEHEGHHGSSVDEQHAECFVCDFPQLSPDQVKTSHYLFESRPKAINVSLSSQVPPSDLRDAHYLRGPPSLLFI